MERCHRTIEDVIKKVITEQTDWLGTLNSVLFSIRCQVHSSTGFSPFWMLYDKDPILPFQLADRSETLEQKGSTLDPVSSCFLQLENGREHVFNKAKQNIMKAQAHQTKCYNNWNGSGTPFEVSYKVLKHNKCEDSQKLKLQNWYTGPYNIVNCSSTGNFYLHDKYFHFLWCSVPPGQLVKFHEKNVQSRQTGKNCTCGFIWLGRWCAVIRWKLSACHPTQ